MALLLPAALGAAQELTTAATAPGADGSAAAAAASLGAAAMSLLKGCARQHGASLAPQAPALAASLPSALEWGLTVTLSSGAQRRHDALTRTLTPTLLPEPLPLPYYPNHYRNPNPNPNPNP